MDSYTPQGTATRLTPADEAASFRTARENRQRGAFQEWPNEAGVSNLSRSPLLGSS